MKRLIFTFLMIMLLAAGGNAAYIVHSVEGNVKLESGGKVSEVAKGMKISPSDVIDIPANSKLEIFNELDGKIYTAVKPGKLSVIRLMLDAKQLASDNGANVKQQLNVGKNGNGGSEVRLYMEKGMVKRSRSVFGADSENVDVDPKTLARYVASAVYTGRLDSRTELPVEVTHKRGGDTGLIYRVANRLDFPVYFNILKITGTEAPVLEVSELGHPDGCYVLLPGQAISREQFEEPKESEQHVMIMSHCRYDIGEVIDIIGDLMSTEGVGSIPEENAPVHMVLL